jgi:hypothetical protein
MYAVQSAGCQWVCTLLVAGQPEALPWLLGVVALVLPVVAPNRREVVLWGCPGALADSADLAVVAHEVRLGTVWYRTIHDRTVRIVSYAYAWVIDVWLDL